MSARLDELGLSFTVESMADLVTHSRHEDLQFFWQDGYWIIRLWHDPSADDIEDQWGAVFMSTDIREVLEEAVHGMFFS